MQFEMDKDTLFDGLSKLVPITEKKSPLPILSHVLIELDDSTITLTATDLEVGLRINYDCKTIEPGNITVPAKKLFEIVKELRPGSVTITSNDRNRLNLQSGPSSFDLAGMDSADFPLWANFDSVKTAEVASDTLTRMLDKTLFAASNDDSRFNLNGVLFERENEKTKLVSTDGHRLALIETELELPIDSKFIVPKKGLIELKRFLENLKQNALFGFEKKNLVVKTERAIMTVRLIDGDYPDYNKVVPQTEGQMAFIDRNSFIQSLKRVAILTSDRNRGINLLLGDGELKISVTNPELGSAEDSVEVEFGGQEVKMIINVQYLLDALGVISSDKVSLEYHKEGAPIIIKPNPPQDYFNIVMPMRK
ncbi:MAG: DNA polymerase III subunit beta [Syntrophaceae bacterium]|nr:DNA polymerase III subunit beta [Syntrophaceae bacterium]